MKSNILDRASMRFFAGFTEASIEAARVRPGERVDRKLPATHILKKRRRSPPGGLI